MTSWRWRFRWDNPVHLILLGLLLRELLAPWTGHPYDLEVWIRNAYSVSLGQDPYAHFLLPVPGLSFAYLNEPLASVGYLPPWSLLVAGIYKLYLLAPQGGRFWFYFLLKQPTVLGDLALGWLLSVTVVRWGGSAADGTRVLRYWMVFPYTIVISAMWGQFDSIVMDLILLSLLTSAWLTRYTTLGLGIVLKWFPVILLPLFALRERGSRRVAMGLALLVAGALTLLVFTLMGWSYFGVTAMSLSASHGGGGGMTYMSVLQSPVFDGAWAALPEGGVAVGLLWIPGCLTACYVASKRFPAPTPRDAVQGLLLVATVFYLTRYGVYEQYLLYFLPLFLIDLVLWHPGRRSIYNFTMILASAYLLVNNDLLVRFFGPVNSSLVDVAYAADISPVLGVLRTAGLLLLDGLITVTLVQLVLVFVRSESDPEPWPVSLARSLRHRFAARPAEAGP